MVLLNDLLEEAALRCNDLAQDADRTLALLEDLISGSEELADTVDSATSDTREHLAELADELESTGDDAADAGQTARSALETLGRRAQETTTSIAQILERVRSGVEGLTTAEQEWASRLETAGEAADQQLQSALGKVNEVQEALGAELEKAAASLTTFQEGLQSAREEWGGRTRDLGEALGALEQTVRERTGQYATEIADILDHQRVDVLVDRLTNELLIDSHNQAVDQLGVAYEDEVPEAAQARVERLRGALSELERLCAEHAEALAGKWTEIAAKAEEAVQAADAILPALQDAQQIP